MATFIMAFIKILVAGLFVPQTMTAVTHESMQVNSSFDGSLPLVNPSYVDNYYSSLTSNDFGHVGPVVLLHTLPEFNTRLPFLTTEEYAIGNFDISGLPRTSSVRVRLPVMYPDVSCSIVDPSEYSLVSDPLGHKDVVVEKRVNTRSRVWDLGTVPPGPGYFSFTGTGITTEKAFSVLFGKSTTNTSMYENSTAVELIEEIYYVDCFPTMYQ
jgi:hypothetical protein